MKRVVLIVVAVLIGFFGLVTTLNALAGSLFGGIGGLLSLPLGGAMLVAAVFILRSQIQQNPGENSAEAQRLQLRTGLRILLIALALLAGLAGLFLSLCGVLLGSSQGMNGAGWLVGIGVVLVIVAIILIVKAVKMR
jgi:hypothetical protein